MSILRANPIPENWTGTLNVGTVALLSSDVNIAISKSADIARSYKITTQANGDVVISLDNPDPFFSQDAGEYTIRITNPATGVALDITIKDADGNNPQSGSCVLMSFSGTVECDMPSGTYILSTYAGDCADCGNESNPPSGGAGYVEEAPTDGKQYGRQNAVWTEITGGGGSGNMTKAVYDPQTIESDAFNRANHTGTQPAATISDFDTEVSNNTTVQQNATNIGIVDSSLTAHVNDTNNPHGTTAAQVGAIGAVQDDTNPTLGGNLNTNGNNVNIPLALVIESANQNNVLTLRSNQSFPNTNSNCTIQFEDNDGSFGGGLAFEQANNRLLFFDYGNSESIDFNLVAKFLQQVTFETAQINHQRGTGNVTHLMKSGIGSGEISEMVFEKSDGTKGLIVKYDGDNSQVNIITDGTVDLNINGVNWPTNVASSGDTIRVQANGIDTQWAP